jgi:hypothetical protein
MKWQVDSGGAGSKSGPGALMHEMNELKILDPLRE